MQGTSEWLSRYYLGPALLLESTPLLTCFFLAPKFAPKASSGVKIGGTDAENHEESGNPAKIYKNKNPRILENISLKQNK